MRRACAAAVLTGAVMIPASAQSPAPDVTPRFEVASVKPNKNGGMLVRFPSGRGQYQVVNIPLRDLILSVYGVRPVQLINAPDWTAVERFDIAARLPVDVEPTAAAQSAMVRALLEDRFALRAHRETRELPVLGLVLARGGGKAPPGLMPASADCAPGGKGRLGPGPDGRPQLPPPGQPSCDLAGTRASIRSSYITMDGLATILSGRLGRMVLNRTGITGAFQIEMTFAAEPTDVTQPSLETALTEQLGLRLESTRAPVDVLVVDSVDRPTPD